MRLSPLSVHSQHRYKGSLPLSTVLGRYAPLDTAQSPLRVRRGRANAISKSPMMHWFFRAIVCVSRRRGSGHYFQTHHALTGSVCPREGRGKGREGLPDDYTFADGIQVKVEPFVPKSLWVSDTLMSLPSRHPPPSQSDRPGHCFTLLPSCLPSANKSRKREVSSSFPPRPGSMSVNFRPPFFLAFFSLAFGRRGRLDEVTGREMRVHLQGLVAFFLQVAGRTRGKREDRN